MRMRKKTHLEERMERQRARLVADPAALRGRWRETLYPEARALRLELGCGKGRFTVETARREPEVLFVAVERVPDAMVIAMERADAMGLRNVFFLDADAAGLGDYFAPGEVDRIYLNFSDPWPSNRQAKRRLTHPDFLRRYAQALCPGGEIHFKTDNRNLFQWSLFQFPKAGYTLSEVTHDLHAQGPQGVMTDYEEKFYAQGKPICRCVAVRGDTLSARLELAPLKPGQEERVTAYLQGFEGEETALPEVEGRGDPAVGSPNDPVKADTLLAVDAESGALIGMAEIAGEELRFSIHPDYRRRGYAMEMLGLVLGYCREERGMTGVWARCGEENAAAIRTILHYGAVLKDRVEGEGEVWRRYWLPLAQ